MGKLKGKASITELAFIEKIEAIVLKEVADAKEGDTTVNDVIYALYQFMEKDAILLRHLTSLGRESARDWFNAARTYIENAMKEKH